MKNSAKNTVQNLGKCQGVGVALNFFFILVLWAVGSGSPHFPVSTRVLGLKAPLLPVGVFIPLCNHVDVPSMLTASKLGILGSPDVSSTCSSSSSVSFLSHSVAMSSTCGPKRAEDITRAALCRAQEVYQAVLARMRSTVLFGKTSICGVYPLRQLSRAGALGRPARR